MARMDHRLLRADVGDAVVIERQTFIDRSWVFEVTRVIHDSQVRHEVYLSAGAHGEHWAASVTGWTVAGSAKSPTSLREAVRAAAVVCDERSALPGRMDADGLVDALDRAGVFLVVVAIATSRPGVA